MMSIMLVGPRKATTVMKHFLKGKFSKSPSYDAGIIDEWSAMKNQGQSF
jgi:hypothetical protein